MIKLVQPQIKELKYRKKLLKDPQTMAFNKSNGGTVDFNEKIWQPWYALWMNDTKYYYAYIYDDTLKKYIGEVSYYFEEEYREYVLNIIVEAKYRHLGKGKEALELLCKQAKENDLRFLCDDIETKAAVKAAYEMDGPVYLRLGRLAAPVINKEDYKFEIGKGVKMREGSDVTIVATGLMVGYALEAAEKLAADGINAEVINIHTIKPLDEDIIVESAKKTGKVVTVEEHSVIGGLGSAVCDALSSKLPTKVTKLGVQDVFGHSGPAVELLKEFKLDGEGIYQQVKETLA